MDEQPREPAIRGAFDRLKAVERKGLPASPYGFDETMARVMRVKPEPKAKKRLSALHSAQPAQRDGSRVLFLRWCWRLGLDRRSPSSGQRNDMRG